MDFYKGCLLYTSTEIKNLNSISNVQKAIEFEAMRQEKVLIQGGEVKQETRRFDEDSKETVVKMCIRDRDIILPLQR